MMVFLKQMRDYRNRISYEGFMINEQYIIVHQEKMESIIKELFEKLN